MPSFHDFRFLSTDGKHKVFARECTPDGEVRAVLQIAHGVAEHIYRYAPFMEFLADNGFVVVANDHLGHGKTAENEQELCFFAEKDGWNDVVSDMDQLHKLTAAKYPDVPYFLFGHSMGSFLTRTYIIDHPEGLKGVIISGVIMIVMTYVGDRVDWAIMIARELETDVFYGYRLLPLLLSEEVIDMTSYVLELVLLYALLLVGAIPTIQNAMRKDKVAGTICKL